MANTYTQLLTDIVEMLKDQQVDETKAELFVRWAEPKMERDILLNGPVPKQMLARVEGAADTNGSYALPSDYAGTRSVTANGKYMREVGPAEIPSAADGYESATIVLDYYQRLPTLVGAGAPESNWLLDVGYDVYVYGACIQYVIWGQEAAVTNLYAGPYSDALRSVKNTYGTRRGGFTRLQARSYRGRFTVEGTSMRFA